MNPLQHQTQWCFTDTIQLEMKTPYSRTSRKSGTCDLSRHAHAAFAPSKGSSFDVTCLLDHKAIQNGVGSFLNLRELQKLAEGDMGGRWRSQDKSLIS